MRVLHVIPAVAARYGGPGVVAVESVRALRAAGVDACLVTTDADGPGRLDVDNDRTIDWQGVPTVVLPLGGEDRFKWSGALARWIESHVREFDLVDVHAVFSHSSIAAGRACRRAGVPYVVRPHGALDPWSLSRHPWQKRLLFWYGVRRLLADAAFIQYTTVAEQSAAQQAITWLPAGRVVPLGVDESYFDESATGTDHERPYVVTMSRLESKKNLEALIAAFHEAAHGALGAWRLVLAGDGARAYVDGLRERARTGPAAERIVFAGWVEGEAKHALLARASVFASPSSQENFGLSLAEAMACGVPALVTPGVNLSPEIGEAGAGWVVEGDASSLSKALQRILPDPHDRALRGDRARRLARRFRWSHSAEVLVELYKETLAWPAAVRHG